MNNNLIKININDYENIINNFEKIKKNIEEIFNNQNKNFDAINETEIWTSRTQKSINSKYNELKKQYEGILLSLDSYIYFMKNALNNYKNLENKLNEDQDKNDTNLDVN